MQDRSRYSEKLLEGILELLPEKDFHAVMKKVGVNRESHQEPMELGDDGASVSSGMDVGPPPLNRQLWNLNNLASRILSHTTPNTSGSSRSQRRRFRRDTR